VRSRRQARQQQEKREERRSRKRAPGGEVIVPHDPVNEMVVIAAVIVGDEKARKLLDLLPADNFYGKGHAEAWGALREIRRQGLSYDPATVQQVSGGKVDVELLEEYVRDRPVVPPNLQHHADCVRWDRARVESARGPVTSFLEALRDPTADPGRLRSLARQVGSSFDGFGSQRFLRDSRQVVREHSRELTERREGRACYPFGIDGLDYYSEGDTKEVDGQLVSIAGQPRLVPGASPTKMTLVTGVSGCGKTTMTCRMTLGLANQGLTVLFGAWEQGSGPTLEIIAAMSLGWSRTDLMVGAFSEEDQAELEAEMERLGEWIRFFELPFGRARGEREFNDKNLNLIQQYIADSAPDVFVADLFRRALKETAPDDEEQALYRMQAITQEQRCHSVLVQQLRLKDVEAREDKRPTRESIKGSSAWVDVPDHIVAWHRPALFKNVADDVVQAIVLKQRYGPWPQAVEFDYEPEYGTIENGHSIEYMRPGEDGDLDSFLGDNAAPRGRRRKREK
jgi:replicative DNA helicase